MLQIYHSHSLTNLKDLLVINKIDLAPLVGADVDRMVRESLDVRGGKPVLCTNCATGAGIAELVERLSHDVLFDR
jgi:urease accessory protein